MASILPVTRHSTGATFLIAASVLGSIGIAQFAAVGVAFFRSTGEGRGARLVPATIDVEKLMAESPPPREEPLSTENPLDDGPGEERTRALVGTDSPEETPPAPPDAPAKPEIPPAPPLTPAPPGVAVPPPRPTPVPLSAFMPKVDPRMTELVEQGKHLRNAGDTAGALVKLREAGGLAPENPLPIAEMAYTYEKMSLPDKAAAEWRRILKMGESAGVYYSAAKSKLDVALSTARISVGGAQDVGTTEVGTFPEGKSLALGRVTAVDDKGAKGKRFTLSIPIRAKEGAVKNPRNEVVTHVRFYDQINNKDLVGTTANVSYRFSQPPADWQDGGIETLEVDYDLSQTGREDPSGENRRYYGYIVRIYFKGALQATFAEPANLAQKFPAPDKLRNND